MNFLLTTSLIVALLFAGTLLCQELGRRIALRHLRRDPDHEKGTRVAESAVFGVLGLFLAFTFSSAASRFEAKGLLIVEEANEIGTAWNNLDVLPKASQPSLRNLFRSYLDARLETYHLIPDMKASDAAHDRALALQDRIWSEAVAAADSSAKTPPYSVVLPSLNNMFEIATSRVAARRRHVPISILVVVGLLTLTGSIFAGYGMASRQSRSSLHSIGFAAVMTLAFYLIMDLEYPRFGFIRLEATDQVLVELRESMNKR